MNPKPKGIMMRASVEVVYYATAITMTFYDRDKAKTAYDKLIEALNGYRKFKNDQSETVEVDAEDGLSTFKLEHINAVLFNEPAQFIEERVRADLMVEKRAREMREELGLPPLK